MSAHRNSSWEKTRVFGLFRFVKEFAARKNRDDRSYTHRKRISRHRPDDEYDYDHDGGDEEEWRTRRNEKKKYSSSFNYISVRPACRASVHSLDFTNLFHSLYRARTPLHEPVIYKFFVFFCTTLYYLWISVHLTIFRFRLPLAKPIFACIFSQFAQKTIAVDRTSIDRFDTVCLLNREARTQTMANESNDRRTTHEEKKRNKIEIKYALSIT